MRTINTQIGKLFYDKENNKYFNYYDSNKKWLGCISARPYKEIAKIKHIGELTEIGLFEFMTFAQTENDLLEEVNNFLIENEEEPFDTFEQLKNQNCFGRIYGNIGKNHFFANYD